MSVTLEKERGEMSGRKAISDAVKKALITILQELYCRGFPIIPRIFLMIKPGDKGRCSRCFWFPPALPSKSKIKVISIS